MRKVLTGFLVLFALTLFSGCGEDTAADTTSDGDTTTPVVENQLSGTVATGEGASATISLVDANGEIIEGRSDANGDYTVSTLGLTQPIMVRATLDSDGSIMYSFAESSSGVVNVTPLTSFIVDQASIAAGLEGGASQLYTSFTQSVVPDSFAGELETQTDVVDTYIESTLSSEDVADFDHFTTEFDANHDGYDAVLDELDIEVYQDDVIIRIDDTILDTLNYDIAVDEINISASIYDVSTDLPIANAQVVFTDTVGNTVSGTTDEDGFISLSIETMRLYDINITADGYAPQYIPEVPSFIFTDSDIGDIPMFPVSETGTTQLSGLLFNARTSDTAIEGATLTFRAGYNERLDTPVQTVTTNASGNYSVELPIGVYTVEIACEDFQTQYEVIEVYSQTSTEDFSLLALVSSDLNATDAFATIVLNWDEEPFDLDAHFTGPKTDDDARFHIAYYNTAVDIDGNDYITYDYTTYDISTESIFDDSYYYGGISCSDNITATLDRDDTDGYGPETMTLCNTTEGGLYKYYVHQFSGNGTMSDGNAQVTLTTASGVTQTFRAPSENSLGTGDVWHVFNIDSYGNIYPVNEIIGSDEIQILAPSFNRTNNDIRFNAESGLLDNLPTK